MCQLFSNIQIKHKVDYLLGNKLYLHPFDRVKGRRPATGQSDVSTVYFPVDNQPSGLFVFCYFINNKEKGNK